MNRLWATPTASTADVVMVELHNRVLSAKKFYWSTTFSSSVDDTHKAEQAVLFFSIVSLVVTSYVVTDISYF